MGIKFGCCGSTINPSIDKIGIEIIEDLKEIGFDYIELSLRDIAALTTIEFKELKKRIFHSGINCEACNNFFPKNIKLTGPQINTNHLLKYLEKSISRAYQLGVKIIVLGSAESKNLSIGLSKEKAWEQIIKNIDIINSVIKGVGITVVIEPINRSESNFILNTREAFQLVKEVNCVDIQLLVDYYHFTKEEEDPEVLYMTKDFLKHIHFSRIINRSFPKNITEDNNYLNFINKLKSIGYRHRIGIEAYTNNFHEDATLSLRFLKDYFS